MIPPRRLARLFALCCALVAPALCLALYPSRPVHLVVPFAAGGATDGVARTVAQALAKSLRQPVIVENRPGADGSIAAQAVAAAPADGYTLLFAVSSMLALPIVNSPPPFDAIADFTPVSTVGRFTFAMYVNSRVPAKTVAEFIAYARAHPGELNYASATMSEYLAASQFMKASGIQLVRVPYKGGAQAMPDLVAGRVQVYFSPISSGLAQVKEGRLRMLAVLQPRRHPMVPDVPTMDEAGLAGVSVPSHQMILAPARTPAEAIERLADEVNLVLHDPAVRAQLELSALAIEGSTPQALAAQMRESSNAWTTFARDNHLVAQ